MLRSARSARALDAQDGVENLAGGSIGDIGTGMGTGVATLGAVLNSGADGYVGWGHGRRETAVAVGTANFAGCEVAADVAAAAAVVVVGVRRAGTADA